jgi:hypothetical protein
MTEVEIRLRCLEEAASLLRSESPTTEKVVEAANEFYKFVCSIAQPETPSR